MREIPVGRHGAFLRQRLRIGTGRSGIDAALRSGKLVPYGKRVLVDRRYQSDFRCRCSAALLAVGGNAVLCGHSVLALHGCDAAERARIHLLVGYERRSRTPNGAALHRGHHADSDIAELDGLPVLLAEVALADVLCNSPRNIGLGCADQLLRMSAPADRPSVRGEVAARIAERPDPRGRAKAEVILGLATGLPESHMESSLLLQVFDAGFPVPDAQHVIRSLNGHEVWRLDFAWPDLKIALEYDGYEAHENREEHDRKREADLRRRGWLLVRAKVTDLTDNGRLMAAIRSAFAARGVCC